MNRGSDLGAYNDVCRLLGKLPGESVNERASICLERCRGRRLRAAAVLLGVGSAPGDAWKRIHAAARILRGLAP